MRDDEQVVVDDSVQYALAGFERVHARGRPAETRRRCVGRRVGLAERIFLARAEIVVGVDAARDKRRGADGRAFEFDAQRLDESYDRDLRGAVDAKGTAGKEAAHR